jgi:hypothetical protein
MRGAGKRVMIPATTYLRPHPELAAQLCLRALPSQNKVSVAFNTMSLIVWIKREK